MSPNLSGYKVWGAAAGGGGGSVTYNQHVIADEYKGPSSYSTGGFVIDLTKTFSTLHTLELVVKKGSRGSLPAVRYEVTRNSPSVGKATVKLMRKRFDQVSAIGNVTGQPAGVTVQAASGVASSSESSHTHSIDHDHGSFTSGNNANSGATVLDQLLGSSIGTHTHTLDIPNFTGTSGAGTSHNHTDNTLYQHQHSANQTSTSFAGVEIANATDLSATTWYLCATGVKV